MRPIYTDEAKSLLDETFPAAHPRLRRGTLHKFLHDGSSNVFSCHPQQRRQAASLYTSGVDAAITKLSKLLGAYENLSSAGLFEQWEPVPAHPEGMIYWDSLRRAVDLVVLYDILVALTYKYPNAAERRADVVRSEGLVIAMRPLVRTRRATRILNSGRAFE